MGNERCEQRLIWSLEVQFMLFLPFSSASYCEEWGKSKNECQQQGFLAAGIRFCSRLSALTQALAGEDTEDFAQQTLIVAFFIQIINLNIIERIAWVRTWLLIPVWGRTLFLPCLWLLHWS